jgi:hypothetical protein
MRETTAAARAETFGFAVGVGNVERRIHDAERVGTMRKPRRVPQLVHRLLDRALQQSLFVATSSAVKSTEPHHRAPAADRRFAEDAAMLRRVQRGSGHGQHPPLAGMRILPFRAVQKRVEQGRGPELPIFRKPVGTDLQRLDDPMLRPQPRVDLATEDGEEVRGNAAGGNDVQPAARRGRVGGAQAAGSAGAASGGTGMVRGDAEARGAGVPGRRNTPCAAMMLRATSVMLRLRCWLSRWIMR